MWRNCATNLRLFADDHTLQKAWVLVSKISRNGGIARPHLTNVADCAKVLNQAVEIVSDFVDCPLFRFRQFACGRVEGTLFEEEPHFVARGEEIVIADML